MNLHTKAQSLTLKQWRENLGYTQDEFGELIGCNGRSISQYERGIRTPELAIFAKMVRRTSANPETLLEMFCPEEMNQ